MTNENVYPPNQIPGYATVFMGHVMHIRSESFYCRPPLRPIMRQLSTSVRRLSVVRLMVISWKSKT